MSTKKAGVRGRAVAIKCALCGQIVQSFKRVQKMKTHYLPNGERCPGSQGTWV